MTRGVKLVKVALNTRARGEAYSTQVFARTLTGKCITLDVDLYNDTVLDLKYKI